MYKSTEAILYPDKILVSTHNITISGIRIPTGIITWLPVKVSNGVLGETVRKHLQQSLTQISDNYEARTLTSMYAKATGLKTRKLQMEKAKLVSIIEFDKRLMIIPTENKGSCGYNSGYYNLLWQEIICDKSVKNKEFGKLIRECWNRCK
jgi:hypothetical protein